MTDCPRGGTCQREAETGHPCDRDEHGDRTAACEKPTPEARAFREHWEAEYAATYAQRKDANDRMRAFQAALVLAATELARQHGLSPSEVGVTVHLRLPPDARMVQVQICALDVNAPDGLEPGRS